MLDHGYDRIWEKTEMFPEGQGKAAKGLGPQLFYPKGPLICETLFPVLTPLCSMRYQAPLFLVFHHQDIKGQFWNDDDSEGDNESEEFLYGVQGSCAADLYRHPQLDADIEAVKEVYSENSVSIREYGTIDDVDVDLHITISFLDEEVSTAWKVLRTEPIVLRLQFSLSQYLDGLEPSIEVFQSSNKE